MNTRDTWMYRSCSGERRLAHISRKRVHTQIHKGMCHTKLELGFNGVCDWQYILWWSTAGRYVYGLVFPTRDMWVARNVPRRKQSMVFRMTACVCGGTGSFPSKHILSCKGYDKLVITTRRAIEVLRCLQRNVLRVSQLLCWFGGYFAEVCVWETYLPGF